MNISIVISGVVVIYIGVSWIFVVFIHVFGTVIYFIIYWRFVNIFSVSDISDIVMVYRQLLILSYIFSSDVADK